MKFFSKNTRALHEHDSIAHAYFSTLDSSVLPSFIGVDAISNPDVLTAVNMLASDVASLKIVSKDNEDLANLINTKPNEVLNGFTFKYVIVANLILNGNVFVEITRNENGRAIRLDLISNDRVTIKKAHDNKHIAQINYEIKNIKDSNVRKIKGNDMLHFKMMSIDGIQGQSPLKSLQNELSSNKFSKDFLTNFFKNGTHTSGTLTTEQQLSLEAKEELRKEWQKLNSGTDNAHKVAIIDSSVKYDAIKVDTELIKLINGNNATKSNVASVLGIPLHKMGVSTSNMDLAQLNQDYLIGALNSYLNIILSELHKLDEKIDVNFEFNVDTYKNIDAKQLRENLKIERELGVTTVDEARLKLGMQPIGGDLGSQLLTSLNYVDSRIANDYQLNKSSSKKGGVKNE